MSPVVLTVVVTMLPAVFTGTVMSEQPAEVRHRNARKAQGFMRLDVTAFGGFVIQTHHRVCCGG